MTIAEAARRLGISPAAVRTLVRDGILAHYRPTAGGRKIVLDEADVEAHRERSRREGAGPRVAPVLRWFTLPERGGRG